jgi:hypothetical protein
MWNQLNDGIKWWIIFICPILAWLLSANYGCGPTKPTIETGIVQSFQAANASMLAQVDWKQVATNLHGKVGPDTTIVVEVYQKIGGAVEIRFRGAELEMTTTGSGTGGGWETNKEIWPDLMQIQQRWERADDASKADKRKWADEIADAIAKRIAEDSAAKTPAVIP